MVQIQGCFKEYWKIFLIIFLYFWNPPASAQLVPDNSLGAESSLLLPGLSNGQIPFTQIQGGARRGGNLFHSFRDFNIPVGQGAYFTNPIGVTAIINRVTGSNVSKIFGTLGVLGNANLFFLNPNGIIFGADAQLDLNGSFLASTADSITLSDGNAFSAKQPSSVRVLTSSVPMGLDFGNNPGRIEVRGKGHNILRPGDQRLPSFSLAPINGLRLKPGKHLL